VVGLVTNNHILLPASLIRFSATCWDIIIKGDYICTQYDYYPTTPGRKTLQHLKNTFPVVGLVTNNPKPDRKIWQHEKYPEAREALDFRWPVGASTYSLLNQANHR
jgi:hypothetical protein